MQSDPIGLRTSQWLDDHLRPAPVIARLSGATREQSVRLANMAWDAGVEHVLIPLEREESVKALQAVVRAGNARGKSTAAGNITTNDHVVAALNSQCAFLTSPGFDRGIALNLVSRTVPFIPGAAIPTDLMAARQLGLTWVSAFPAALLGTEWIRAMRTAFPDVRFIAAGGINLSDAQQFLDADCAAVEVEVTSVDAAQSESLHRLVARSA